MVKKSITSLNMDHNQMINMVLENSEYNPSNPVKGQVYYNTDNGIPSIHDGVSFKKVLTQKDEDIYFIKNASQDAEINNIKALLVSDDTDMDELQELINFIKSNKEDLDNLSINNIAGLSDYLEAQEIELRQTVTHLQWRRVGGTWINLIAIEDLLGLQGIGISDITSEDNEDGTFDITFVKTEGLPQVITTPNLIGPQGVSFSDVNTTHNIDGSIDIIFSKTSGPDEIITTPDLRGIGITNITAVNNLNGTFDLVFEKTIGPNQVITTPVLTGPQGVGFTSVTKTDNLDGTIDIIFGKTTGGTQVIKTPDLTGPQGVGFTNVTKTDNLDGSIDIIFGKTSGVNQVIKTPNLKGVGIIDIQTVDNGNGSFDIVFERTEGPDVVITTPVLTGPQGISVTGITSTSNPDGSINIIFGKSSGGNQTIVTPNLKGVGFTSVTSSDNGNGTMDITFAKTEGVSQVITTPNFMGPQGVSTYLHISYAEDIIGTNASPTASGVLPWRSEIITSTPTYPAGSNFLGKYLKYLGRDGVDGEGAGDMLKIDYDTNGNGKVDVAELAESVAWSGVTGKPALYTKTEADALVGARVLTTDIKNNLISTDVNKPLSANQGKILKGLIDDISTLLSSDDTTLDEIQELVNFIKQNKSELDNLGIGNISGLTAALAGKASSVHNHNDLYNTKAELTAFLLGKSDSGHIHDGRYYTQGQVDTYLSAKADGIHSHNDLYNTKTQITSLLSGKSDTSHDHDTRYNTKQEIIDALDLKAAASHDHNSIYYTKTELNSSLGDKSNVGHSHAEYLTDAEYAILAANKSDINIEVTVTTGRTTAAKVGTTSSGTYTPAYGDKANVTFTLGCSVNTPTLNIDGSGAKNIRLGGINVGTTLLSTPAVSNTLQLFYDGTYWEMYGSQLNTAPITYIATTSFATVSTNVTTATAVNRGYIANYSSELTFNLPTTSAIGQVVEVLGLGSGGWKLNAPAGDNILINGIDTGVAGYISGGQYDSVQLRCIVANTTWEVISYTGIIATGLGYTTEKVTLADPQTLENKTATGLNLTAGTATVPVLQMTAGVKMTTATAGSFEYDGIDLFFNI